MGLSVVSLADRGLSLRRRGWARETTVSTITGLRKSTFKVFVNKTGKLDYHTLVTQYHALFYYQVVHV